MRNDECSVILLFIAAFNGLLTNAFTSTPITSRETLLPPQIPQPLLRGKDVVRAFRVFSTVPQNDDVGTLLQEVVSDESAKVFNSISTKSKIRKDLAVAYDQLTIGVLKETYIGEKRVSQSPDSVATLVKAGFNVIVQSGGE
jgi:hypothetical protein